LIWGWLVRLAFSVGWRFTALTAQIQFLPDIQFRSDIRILILIFFNDSLILGGVAIDCFGNLPEGVSRGDGVGANTGSGTGTIVGLVLRFFLGLLGYGVVERWCFGVSFGFGKSDEIDLGAVFLVVFVLGTEAEIVFGAGQKIFETEGVFLLVFRFFLFLFQALVDSVFDGAFGVSVGLESDSNLVATYDTGFDFRDIQVVGVFVVIIFLLGGG